MSFTAACLSFPFSCCAAGKFESAKVSTTSKPGEGEGVRVTVDAAAREGLRIVAVAETHIHADFLSGARELAERVGAHVYVGGEGGPEWQSKWAKPYAHTSLHDGTEFKVGSIAFRALHTPGHTPEHVSYLVTDLGGGASEPLRNRHVHLYRRGARYGGFLKW